MRLNLSENTLLENIRHILADSSEKILTKKNIIVIKVLILIFLQISGMAHCQGVNSRHFKQLIQYISLKHISHQCAVNNFVYPIIEVTIRYFTFHQTF